MPSIADLERLLAADPRDAFVLYGLGQEHARHGQHDLAIGFYDRCLESDSGYLYAFYFKAKSLHALGRVDDALGVARAGHKAAQKTGNFKASSELQGLIDEIEP